MEDVLHAEMKRLLSDAPYGAPAALARHLGVEHASVSAWRRGLTVPLPDRWPEIEKYLGIPEGHLARSETGRADTTVVVVWPPSPGKNGRGRGAVASTRAGRASGTATPPGGAAELQERVELLGSRVEALARQVLAMGDEIERLRRRSGPGET